MFLSVPTVHFKNQALWYVQCRWYRTCHNPTLDTKFEDSAIFRKHSSSDQRHVPQGLNLQQHRRENLKPRVDILLSTQFYSIKSQAVTSRVCHSRVQTLQTYLDSSAH